jgi:hypothetical protein
MKTLNLSQKEYHDLMTIIKEYNNRGEDWSWYPILNFGCERHTRYQIKVWRVGSDHLLAIPRITDEEPVWPNPAPERRVKCSSTFFVFSHRQGVPIHSKMVG